jgi:PAS domain-containing protein
MSFTPSFHLDSTCLPLHRLAAFEQTILDGIKDLLLVLAPDGCVLHASQMCFALTTLTPQHLVGNHISRFMHYDDLPVFLDEFNTNMLVGKPWRFHHRLRRADDTFAVFESTFNPFVDTTSFQTAGYPGLRKCLMTIRSYFSPSAALLDSYLDLITAQARLTGQLKQLRAGTDEDEEEEAQVVDEYVKQELDACVSRTTKTQKKVSSIRVLLHFTDNLQGPFRDRDL